MPIQSQEVVGIEGQTYPLLSRPLGSCVDPAILGRMKQLKTPSNHLHRGYLGSWEIRDGSLLLVDLKATIRDWDQTKGWHLVERGLAWMFPGARGHISADWFSGELECAQGLPERVNDSFVMWPTLKVLQVRRGEVTGSHLVDQRHEMLAAARTYERSAGWTGWPSTKPGRQNDLQRSGARKVGLLVAA